MACFNGDWSSNYASVFTGSLPFMSCCNCSASSKTWIFEVNKHPCAVCALLFEVTNMSYYITNSNKNRIYKCATALFQIWAKFYCPICHRKPKQASPLGTNLPNNSAGWNLCMRIKVLLLTIKLSTLMPAYFSLPANRSDLPDPMTSL